MKTVKKITLVVLMLVSTLSYAEKSNSNFIASITVVEFANAKKGQQLLVKDEFGITLHSETVSKTGKLTKIFDLRQLKNGKYTIELDKDFEIKIKTFEVKNNIVTFLTEKEFTEFKPVIRREQNKLLISQMSLDLNPLNVELYYGDDLIYSETIKDEKSIKRVYELSKHKTGEYHTVITSEDRTYINYFNL